MPKRSSDLSRFDSIVAGFATDLATDVRYAVEIVQTAKAIEKKRKVWADRLEYRRIAKEGINGKPTSWPPFADGWATQDAIDMILWALDYVPSETPVAPTEPAPAPPVPKPKVDGRSFAKNGDEQGTGRSRRVSPERKAQLGREAAKLRTDGHTWTDIGAKLGISNTTAERWARAGTDQQPLSLA